MKVLNVISSAVFSVVLTAFSGGSAFADVSDDLEAALGEYFEADVTLTHHEFLRHGATVTGIAFPKYYLWIEGVEDGEVFEGAVRVADQNGSVVVTHFLSVDEVLERRSAVGQIFPAPLVERIIEMAASAN